MHPSRRYLSTIEIQRELGISARHVTELIRCGRLPAFQLLGQWRVERELLERMVDDLYQGSADPLCRPGPAAAPSATFPPAGDSAGAKPSGRSHGFPAALTDQQGRILRLVGAGLSNAEIATHLSVEVSTVKSHVSRILQRCALRDREQLIVLAWRSGLMDDPSAGDPSAAQG